MRDIIFQEMAKLLEKWRKCFLRNNASSLSSVPDHNVEYLPLDISLPHGLLSNGTSVSSSTIPRQRLKTRSPRYHIVRIFHFPVPFTTICKVHINKLILITSLLLLFISCLLATAGECSDGVIPAMAVDTSS